MIQHHGRRILMKVLTAEIEGALTPGKTNPGDRNPSVLERGHASLVLFRLHGAKHLAREAQRRAIEMELMTEGLLSEILTGGSKQGPSARSIPI
jgi:hypothetical protein